MCEIYKDKKIFICHVYGMNNEYSILAKDDEEAKKILVDFLNKTYGSFNLPYTIPYNRTDKLHVITDFLPFFSNFL